MRELTKVQTINDACDRATVGRGRAVWADLMIGRDRIRIMRARVKKGELQVRPVGFCHVSVRRWYPAVRVYTD